MKTTEIIYVLIEICIVAPLGAFLMFYLETKVQWLTAKRVILICLAIMFCLPLYGLFALRAK
jgi:MFS-type transporter involved in bile tolerance (Atg22 family)